MLRTVRLYGKLREKCGVDSVQLTGDSVAELVSGLSANFKHKLQPTPDSPRMLCRVKGHSTLESIRTPLPSDESEIHLYPALIGAGGGNGSLMKIIIGAIMIVAFVAITVATGGATLAALPGLLASGQLALTAFGSFLLFGGSMMILGGLMEMLAPQPTLDMSAANNVESSKYLGAQQNTVRIGTPIPLLFGRHRVHGHFISFNVDTKTLAGGGAGAGAGSGTGDDGAYAGHGGGTGGWNGRTNSYETIS